jgi:hypothetical protein
MGDRGGDQAKQNKNHQHKSKRRSKNNILQRPLATSFFVPPIQSHRLSWGDEEIRCFKF